MSLNNFQEEHVLNKLKDIFGHEDFKSPLQKKAILTILSRNKFFFVSDFKI